MEHKKSPFPGMDPYLERPAGWRGVHASFLTYLRDGIAERLPARYYARLEDRVYLDEEESRARMPDVRVVERPVPRRGTATAVAEAGDPIVVVSVAVEEIPEEIAEHYIEIRDADTGHNVVTVIELLSPANKRRATEGWHSYRAKQQEVLASDANLVEIDLLRGGEHVAAVPLAVARARCGRYHYLVVVRRAARRDERELYPVRLDARLARIAVPLREPDADVVADLQAALERAYVMGAYGATIDYGKPADPPLGDEDAAWARGRVGP